MTDINALKYLNLSTRKKDKMKENIKRLTWKKKKKTMNNIRNKI